MKYGPDSAEHQERTATAIENGRLNILGLGFERLLPATSGTISVGARLARDSHTQRVARKAGSYMGGWIGSVAVILA